MNWDELKQKAMPFVDKAKEAGFKALDFTQKQMQGTPVVLKNSAEFDAIKTEKRAIILSYTESDQNSREILLRTPVWGAQAWTDNAVLRFVILDANPDLAGYMGVSTPMHMSVWYEGEKTFETTQFDAMVAWWQDRCYTKKEGEAGVETPKPPESNPDPLAAK